MVRRRADQAHARDGVTSLGYVRRHLNNHITCPMNYFLNLPPVSHSAELQERAPYAFFYRISVSVGSFTVDHLLARDSFMNVLHILY